MKGGVTVMTGANIDMFCHAKANLTLHMSVNYV